MGLIGSEWAIWEYRAVYTQANAAGGNVIIDISGVSAGKYELLEAVIGPDNYAAGRTTEIYQRDSDNNSLGLLVTGSIDNTQLVFPYADGTQAVTQLKAGHPIEFGGNTKISIEGTALAQNETLTVYIKVKVFGGWVPTVASTRSGGTVGAPTVTFNQVLIA